MRITAALFSTILLCGCQELYQPRGLSNGLSFRAPGSRVTYVIDPPDKIELLVPKVAELNRAKQAVESDGMVRFEGIEAVSVAGKSPDEAAELLEKAIRKKYPKVDVRIDVCARSKWFFAYGYGVATQSKYTFTEGETLTRALLEIGFDETIWPEQVRLVRPGKNGGADETVLVDYSKMFESGAAPEDYLLESGDMIEVTRTPFRRQGNIPTTKMSAEKSLNKVHACGREE